MLDRLGAVSHNCDITLVFDLVVVAGQVTVILKSLKHGEFKCGSRS